MASASAGRARPSAGDGARRRRILFVSENVSLAQVVRLRQLAIGLPAQRYEVSFAASHFDPVVFGNTGFRKLHIHSMSATTMMRRQRLGLRLFSPRTLAHYVREELELMEELRPDLVVGDLRLSLSVSAPALGIPYAALINAYWSPHAIRDAFPMPEHPTISLLGVGHVAPHFHGILPAVFDHFAAPINTLRRRYGLPAIGSLLSVLTHGDHTLHPDVPELTPTADLPLHHHYLGPVLWAPPGGLPEAIRSRRRDRPLVYVTMGSSGGLHVMRRLLRALSALPVTVLLATVGRFPARRLPDNVLALPFVPGDLAAREADLVICNGGSSTGYQALHEGTPVLGLPANFDQYLAMTVIKGAGAGVLLRSGTATADEIAAATRLLLGSDAHRAAAARAATALRAMNSRARFGALVDRVTTPAGSRGGLETDGVNATRDPERPPGRHVAAE